MNTPHNHDHVMRMVAAIIERGDDQLRDQWSGAPTSDGKWVIQLLLAQLGYTLIVTEDGEVQIWPENNDGSGPYIAGGYRYAEVDGHWYHTEAAVREAQHGVVKAGLQEHLDHVVDVLGSVQP